MVYSKVWIQDRGTVFQLLICDADIVLHEEVFIYNCWTCAQTAMVGFGRKHNKEKNVRSILQEHMWGKKALTKDTFQTVKELDNGQQL